MKCVYFFPLQPNINTQNIEFVKKLIYCRECNFFWYIFPLRAHKKVSFNVFHYWNEQSRKSISWNVLERSVLSTNCIANLSHWIIFLMFLQLFGHRCYASSNNIQRPRSPFECVTRSCSDTSLAVITVAREASIWPMDYSFSLSLLSNKFKIIKCHQKV